MADPILLKSDGKLTTITLNRPDVGNRVTNEMLGTLKTMIEGADASRAIVIRAAGDDFCHGRQLPPATPGQILTATEAKTLHAEPVLSLAGAFERAAPPIVGVVRGKVSGGGCAIAGMCDVTIAADNATFQLPEMHHGIPPCLAMAALCRRMPKKSLVHLVYSTEPIDAATAFALGLVSKVVPLAKLDAEADALIDKLTHYAQPATQAVKLYMRSAPYLDLGAAADLAGNLLSNVVSSQR